MSRKTKLFGVGLFLLGTLGFLSLVDFFLNYQTISFIEFRIPGTPYDIMLRIWSFIYMGLTLGIGFISSTFLYNLPTHEGKSAYRTFKLIVVIGNIGTMISAVYYGFLDKIVYSTIVIPQLFLYRLIYYGLVAGTSIVYLIGWIFFLVGSKNDKRNSTVLGSISIILIGNILNVVSCLTFILVWRIYLYYPLITNFLPYIIPLYVVSYTFPVLYIIGFLILGIQIPRHSFKKPLSEPTLNEPIEIESVSSTKSSPKPVYQHPKGPTCPNCGSKVSPNERYCNFCGNAV